MTLVKKNILFYFIVITTILGLSMTVVYFQSKKSFITEGQEKALAIIHTFEAILNGQNLAFYGDTNINLILQSDLDELKKNLPSLEEFTIYKIANQTAIASSISENKNKRADPEDLKAAQDDQTVIIIDNENGKTIVDVTAPLHLNHKIDYVCGVKFSIEDAMGRIRALLFTMLVVGLICLIISATLSLLITKGLTKKIDRIVTGLNESSNQVAAASNQLSGAAQQLSQGSSEQASAIEETSSTLQEATSTLQQNNANTNQAAQLSEQAKDFADKRGNLEMQHDDAISIEEIKKSSDQIAKIIRIIDDIAFQTNILALNAAIEAARAGEAGMGLRGCGRSKEFGATQCARAKDTTVSLNRILNLSNQGVNIAEKVRDV